MFIRYLTSTLLSSTQIVLYTLAVRIVEPHFPNVMDPRVI